MIDPRTHQLILLLRAIDNMQTEKAVFMADWKSRMETLEADLRKLREDILSGQSDLFVSLKGEGEADASQPPSKRDTASTGG